MTHSWRILLLLFVAARKGAYWRAFHFARHLVQRSHQVTLMAMSPQNRIQFRIYQDHSVTIVETPDLLWGALRSGWDVWDCLRRILWLRGHRFDLAHVFDARPTAILPALYLQSRHVLELIAKPACCALLGQRARQAAEEVFDWRFQTIKLEALYEQALSRRPDLAL